MRDGCRYHIKVEYMDGNGKNTKQNSGQKIKQSARRRNPNLRLVKNGDKLVKEENSSKGARGSFGEKEAGETKKAVQKGRKEPEEAKKGAQQEKAEAKPEKKAGEKKGTGETKKSTRKRKRVSGEKKKKTAEGQKSAEGKVRRSGKKKTPEEEKKETGEKAAPEGKIKGAKGKAEPRDGAKKTQGKAEPEGEAKKAQGKARPGGGAKKTKGKAEPGGDAKKAKGKAEPESEAKKAKGKAEPESEAKKAQGKAEPEGETKKAGGKTALGGEKKEGGEKEKPEGEKKKTGKKRKKPGKKKETTEKKKSLKTDSRKKDRDVYRDKPELGEWFVQHRSLVIIGFTIFACCAFLAGIYYYITTAYKVTTVYVDGNVHYTNEEVMDMVMKGRYGKNSLYLAMKYKDKGVEGIPFVEKMDVNILTPNTIRISVYEKALAGYVEYLGRYMYFDRDGTVVESSSERTRGIPQVTGLRFDYVVVNEPLPVENDEIFKRILDITQLLNKYELTADKIFFDSSYNLTLFFGEVRVTLGSSSEIDQKIIKLKNILPELEGKSGTLQMENYTEDTKNITFHQE